MSMTVIIDATDHVMGRLSSEVAKRILRGEEIIVVNAEKTILTGTRSRVFHTFLERKQRGSTTSRMRGIGPLYPRRPDMILRRTISRMVPHQQARGREALKRLRVYMDVPAEYKAGPFEVIPTAKRPPQGPVMSLGEVSRMLGSKF